MQTSFPSVRIETTAVQNVIKMIWAHEVDSQDVLPAFDKIVRYLDDAKQPVYVLVDILSDPKFPLKETISSALWTSYRHHMLAEWLVIGTNSLAHAIERTLSGVTRRKNVRWFKSEEEALDYLETQHTAKIEES